MISTKTKKITVCVIIAVLALIIIVCSSLSLAKISDRRNTYFIGKTLKAEVKRETVGLSAEEVRSYSIKKTAEFLSFAVKNDLPEGEANCVGYAQMCASICSYAFWVNGIRASAKPVVGYVMLGDVNLCYVLKWLMPNRRWENFVKDHDFVEFRFDGKTVYADACIYDLMWNDCKTVIVDG